MCKVGKEKKKSYMKVIAFEEKLRVDPKFGILVCKTGLFVFKNERRERTFYFDEVSSTRFESLISRKLYISFFF